MIKVFRTIPVETSDWGKWEELYLLVHVYSITPVSRLSVYGSVK